MKSPQKNDLIKISDYIWEIPKSFREDMKVPARIFASEKMLDELFKDRSLWQLVNMTTLPGAYKYALAMPDVHEGYGFCLSKDAKVLTEFGYFIEISHFEKLKNAKVLIFDKKEKKLLSTNIKRFFKIKPYNKIFRIETESGFSLIATEDHPIYTPFGMRKIEELKVDDFVAIYGFEGIQYEKPSSEIIVNEKDIEKTIKKLFLKNYKYRFEIIKEKLKKRNLLPLTFDNPKLPYLIKILAFVFGDASMNFIRKKKDGVIHFAGKKEDLVLIREDLKKLGYTSSKIFERKRKNVSYNFYVDASSLVILLHTLGAPLGNKAYQAYRVPQWLFKAPLWQKRLFLATLFGCELRKPYKRQNRKSTFSCPYFPMNKRIDLIENGKEFLKDIAKLCKEFGVKTTKIQIHRYYLSKKNIKTAALELVFSSETDSLINLYSKISYEYCRERKFLASIASVYLRLKKKMLEEKYRAIKITIPELLRQGLSYQKIADKLAGNSLTKRFITNVCYKINKGIEEIKPKIHQDFPNFNQFLKERTKNLGESGFVWDRIKKIEEIDFEDYVYDLTVSDENHNFIANGFLVSNCVGGILATDIEVGTISPGGVGFDINCLPPESKINLPFGTYLKIEDTLENKKVVSISLKSKKLKISPIKFFLKRKENNYLLKITTKLGYTLRLTKDHPVLTINGMKEAKNILIGEKVVIYPFQGIKYERPKPIKIIDENEFIKKARQFGLNNNGNRISQMIKFLKKRELLPLYLDSKKFPYIIKIFGYVLVNGYIDINKEGEILNLTIWGRKEDLKLIKEDLGNLGIKSFIVKRKRKHKLLNNYNKIYFFERDEYYLRISSSAFSLLLVLLGYPLGNKTQKSFSLPKFLNFSPLWQKRLFLASFFGAELSSVRIFSKNKFNFYVFTFNINKSIAKLKNGIQFLKEIKNLLKEFKIETSKIKIIKELGIKNKTIGLRFQIKPNLNNLEKFLSLINFEYHQEKKKLANLALAYIKYKKKILEERKNLKLKLKILYSQGAPVKVLFNNYQSEFINKKFIEKSIWENYTEPRIAYNVLKFDEFVKIYSFGSDGFIIDEIEKIEKENYQGYVYDLSLNDKDHNFIADNFVVSNCGVRLLVSPFYYDEIKEKVPKLTEEIYRQVPSGVGEGGFWKLNNDEMNKVLSEGAKWLLEIGYAKKEDIEATESNGKLDGANPDKVSKNAKDRGRDQLGTIGAGNHFVEIQKVQEVFDEEIAKKLSLEKNKVCLLIHCGSRGLGHQVATDYIRQALKYLDRKNIDLVDRELAYFDFNSPEGQDYFEAMKAAANFAFANRQLIVYEIRKAFKKVFGKDIELKQVYDVAHNIVKVEEYDKKKLLVHRKGATRSFPKNHPELVSKYKEIGQPTLIPGSMGTLSYVLIGQQKAMEISFGSSPHGAGRMMSRTEAKKKIRGNELKKELEARGISVAAGSMSGLAEEAPVAYKDVSEVVDVVHNIGISKKIVKLVPIGVIKG